MTDDTIPDAGGMHDAGVLSAYMLVLQRNLKLIGICAVTGLVVALLISAVMRAEYEATARMAVELENGNSLEAARPTLDGSQTATKLETQLSILQSDQVAKAVIDNLRLAANCMFSKVACGNPAVPFREMTPEVRAKLLKAYHKGLHAELVPRTQIIEVRFRSRDPRLAADVANAIVTVDIDQNFRQRVNAVQKASAWLNGQLDDVKKQAETAQARFVAYQQKVGIVGADDDHNIALNRVDELNRRLATVEADRILKEAQYRVAVAGNPELIAAVVPESVILTLRKQQATLREQYAEAASKYGENYPRVVQLHSQLNDLQGVIDQEVVNIRVRAQQEYEAAQRSEQMLQGALESQKHEALRADASSIQYALLQRDVQTSRDLYESLVKKLKDAGIDQGLRSGDLRLVDEAEIPMVPVRPQLLVNLILGLFGGLTFGVGAGFLRSSFDRSIRTPNDVEAQCLLPALAMIPNVSARTGWRDGVEVLQSGTWPVTFQRPESEAAEAYRSLRTTILSPSGAAPRAICFVSGSGREGKSTSAVNTAIVLAQQGKRVLLVDADLRCPTIHTQLRLPLEEGLSELLSGKCMPTPVRVPETSLFVLRAGARSPYISELLSSARMKSLMEQWRDEYDFVVIDTPPVLAFTDAVIMAGLADATILVVRSTSTNIQSLRYVKQRLERAHARIFGVLLNDVQFESFESAHYSDRRAYARYQGSMIA